MASLLATALTDHVVPTTQRAYRSAAADYERFCRARGLSPWPADGVRVAAWVVRLASYVRYPSLRVYLAALQYTQLLRGLPWSLSGDPCVRAAVRWVKRNFPVSSLKGAKFPVTLSVLRKVLPALPGWPVLGALCHEDRLFAVANLLAVFGYLRGGEFLSSRSGSRPILRIAMVYVRRAPLSVVLSIPQPKNCWWVPDVDVPVFALPGDPFCPVSLWRSYLALSPAVLRAGGLGASAASLLPAFHSADGSALSRDALVRRLGSLCRVAGVPMVDESGRALPLKMASWRAGAVRSAKDAGVGEAFIMPMGRWSSSAWRFYLLQTQVDLQGASLEMWRRSASAVVGPRVEVVPSAVPECVARADAAVVEDVRLASSDAEVVAAAASAAASAADAAVGRASRRRRRLRPPLPA